MVNGYWKWLIGGLAKFGLAFLRLVPKVIFKVIPGIFKAGFGFLKEIIMDSIHDSATWDNVCAVTGSVFLMGLIFWLLALGTKEIEPVIMFWWGIGEVVLFLIGTYAYWRDNP